MGNDIFAFAKYYWDLGLNIAAIKNETTEFNIGFSSILKSPYHEWEKFIIKRQNFNELSSLDWKVSINLGVILGYENLIAFDFDFCTDYTIVEDFLHIIGLPSDYEWVIRTGSNMGYSVLARTESPWNYKLEFPHGASYQPFDEHKLSKLEVLTNLILVLPPSIHQSGNFYSFRNCNLPINKPILILDRLFQKTIIKLFKGKAYELDSSRKSNSAEPIWSNLDHKKSINQSHVIFEIIFARTRNNKKVPLQIALLQISGTSIKKCYVFTVKNNDELNFERLHPRYYHLTEKSSKIGFDLQWILKEIFPIINNATIIGYNIRPKLNYLINYYKEVLQLENEWGNKYHCIKDFSQHYHYLIKEKGPLDGNNFSTILENYEPIQITDLMELTCGQLPDEGSALDNCQKLLIIYKKGLFVNNFFRTIKDSHYKHFLAYPVQMRYKPGFRPEDLD